MAIMNNLHQYRSERRRSGRALILAGAALSLVAGLVVPVWADQLPACPPTNPAVPENTPPAPMQPPRPIQGPNSVAEFMEGVTHNDARFDIAVGQGRILTTKVELAIRGKQPALVAVGDPTIIDFAVISSRQIRIVGRRVGVTDLVVTTPENQTYSFEVRVVADLQVLHHQLKCLFPDACLKLTQIRDHVVVEGQARDSAQVTRILETIRAYLRSVRNRQLGRITVTQTTPTGPVENLPPPRTADPSLPPGAPQPPGAAGPEQKPSLQIEDVISDPVIINMIRVPGPKQVLLKVRVAELNRTAFRQIGADFIAKSGNSTFGTRLSGSLNTNPNSAGGNMGTPSSPTGGTTTNIENNILNNGVLNINGGAAAGAADAAVNGFAQLIAGSATTVFGVFGNGDFNIFLSALRRNGMLRILAEPNLVAMDGQAANFLAGGEFPVPVPQSGIGGAATITIDYKKFGVQLAFLPTIQDGDVIRLAVDPEVSSLDFAIGTTIGGTQVPGLNVRKAHTVVEMREGQTLAIAGLLQVSLDGTTDRIPGLGDLPIVGPLFSNTTGGRIEKELVVLITPHLIEPMNCDQVPPTPGDEIGTPSDWEFYFMNRIEVPASRDWRATTNYTTPLLRCMMKLDAKHVRGPSGFCD